MTLTQILLAELILKGTVGTLLVLFPITTARVFGLPHGSVGIWARIAGVLLIGIAAAIWVENDVPDIRGLGLGGLIAINAVGLVGLVAFAVAQTPGPREALWPYGGQQAFCSHFASFRSRICKLFRLTHLACRLLIPWHRWWASACVRQCSNE
jgi:hypothetical protein